jgi:hypothetical protein
MPVQYQYGTNILAVTFNGLRQYRHLAARRYKPNCPHLRNITVNPSLSHLYNRNCTTLGIALNTPLQHDEH